MALSDDLFLPRADEAEIPRETLVEYVLSDEHRTGRHKARVFVSTLGITASDWETLRDQILEQVTTQPVTAIRPKPPFGVEYEIRVNIDGVNGRTHPVITGWLVTADARPRLLTRVRRPATAVITLRDDARDVAPYVVMLKPHDVIELRVAVDAWGAGTVATVLEVAPASVLAEVADLDGRTLEVLTVPLAAARPIEPRDVPRRPKTSEDVRAS